MSDAQALTEKLIAAGADRAKVIKISSMSMFDPIGFYEKDQLVALLMPLKS
jgi:hypothetical protein